MSVVRSQRLSPRVLAARFGRKMREMGFKRGDDYVGRISNTVYRRYVPEGCTMDDDVSAVLVVSGSEWNLLLYNEKIKEAEQCLARYTAKMMRL